MSNIIDYVDWRGDLTFEQDSFNQVDAVVFSQLKSITILKVKNINIWD